MSAFRRFASADEAEAFAAENGGKVRHIPARADRTYKVPDEAAIEAAIDCPLFRQWVEEVGEAWGATSTGHAVVGVADLGGGVSNWGEYIRPSRREFWGEHQGRFPTWAARCRALVQEHQQVKVEPGASEAYEVMWEPADNTDYSSSDWYALQ